MPAGKKNRPFVRVTRGLLGENDWRVDGDPYIEAEIRRLLGSASIKTIIETGTNRGHTTRAFSDMVAEVVTIEIDQNFWDLGKYLKISQALWLASTAYGASSEERPGARPHSQTGTSRIPAKFMAAYPAISTTRTVRVCLPAARVILVSLCQLEKSAQSPVAATRPV